MSSERARLLLTLACVLSIMGGCASVPPAPPNAPPNVQNGVLPPVAASAPAEQPSAVGPMVPGPASPTASRLAAPPTSGSAVIPVSGECPAGPPPSIPAELPGPPAGAVSINDAKSKEKEEEEKKKAGFEWSDLDPDNIYKKLKKASGHGPDEKIAHEAMHEGEALFRDAKYKEAAAKFATAADRSPDSPLEEDALFLQAESEFFSDQYSKAHDTYGGLLKKYANTRHLDTVAAREFALGRYWEQMYDAKPTWPTTPNFTDNSRPMFDTFGYAIQAYERVRQYDPTGPLADASLMALGNAYFRHGRYEDAAFNYDTLCKEYPNSKYQMSATFLDLPAKMRVYQGTYYDETPLKDAGKIADQTLAQFGNKLGDERERVLKARVQIIEEKANRDYTLGEYYAQHKLYGAARLYYKSVIDKYPATEMAKQARARMEQYRNEPDEPPSRFAWLTGMFGSKK